MTISRKLTPSSFDIALLTKELGAILVNTRLNAVVNVSKTTYLLRFHASNTALERCPTRRPDLLEAYTRPALLIEPGFHAHTTVFDRCKIGKPTAFTLQLRSELSNLICLGVTQFYFDRVIVLAFGRYGGDVTRRLVVELYGRGNVFVCDENYTIITSQAQLGKVVPGANYLSTRKDLTTYEQVRARCSFEYFTQVVDKATKQKGQAACIRAAIAQGFYLGGSASAVIMRALGLKTSIKARTVQQDEALLKRLWAVCEGVLYALFDALDTSVSSLLAPGYLYFYKRDEIEVVDSNEDETELVGTLLDAVCVAEYHPFDIRKIHQECTLYDDTTIRMYPSFNQTVDEYTSLLETARGYQARAQLLLKAKSILTHAQTTTDERVQALMATSAKNRLQAECMIWKAAYIDNSVRGIKMLFDKGKLTWKSIGEWLSSNPGQSLDLIASVDPAKKIITIEVPFDQEDVESMGLEGLKVLYTLDDVVKLVNLEDIDDVSSDEELPMNSTPDEEIGNDIRIALVKFDIHLPSWRGAQEAASQLYGRAKEAEEKGLRTVGQSNIYLKKIEKKSLAEAAKAISDTDARLVALQRQRAPLWFERFNWFISTDGCLVLAGRDAQSNELLVKKFMGPVDIFVHSEAHGAACTVIKCPPIPMDLRSAKDDRVLRWLPPQQTVLEAGAFTVANSKAWTQNVPLQAYWVYADQVTKTAPTGTFVGTGSFVIRGKRNYLPAQSMELGICLLWRYDEPRASLWYTRYSSPLKEDEYTIEAPIRATSRQQSDSIIVANTQRQKNIVRTAEQAERDKYKDERKQKQKERQEKIKQQKLQAKIRRLISEGREEEAAACQRRLDGEKDPEEAEVEQVQFCDLCGTIGHTWESCTTHDLARFRTLRSAHISPVLAQMWDGIDLPMFDQGVPEDEVCGDMQDDMLKDTIVSTSGAQEKELSGTTDSSEYSALFTITTERPTDEQGPGLLVMIAPYSVVKDVPYAVKIVPGQMTRGKAHRLLQQVLLGSKMLSPSKYEQLVIKQIPEHAVILGVPGPFQMQGYGVGKAVHSVTARQNKCSYQSILHAY
ncbi:Serologically defined colon cancer antigen 1 [Giardia muris]|uniref:Serologically defined colon cancer antigen 1 n=1 Tax=Giardia muris TaxID=5742 RepID=A0A4Z1SNN1_GIAMU|nr:Serologically defined colon cancer antigen 1 [Giardia muris]|eukprot:TNJ27366.1 Serologically defined colon cancer antigen 1 [Giardia muris]